MITSSDLSSFDLSNSYEIAFLTICHRYFFFHVVFLHTFTFLNLIRLSSGLSKAVLLPIITASVEMME